MPINSGKVMLIFLYVLEALNMVDMICTLFPSRFKRMLSNKCCQTHETNIQVKLRHMFEKLQQ